MVQVTYNSRLSLAATILLAAAIFLMTGNNGFANTGESGNVKISTVKNQFSERAIKDLVRGIESDNAGLMKSSIYYAGLYEIDETVYALVKKLKSEESADIRILIALALYKIGNDEGMAAVQELATNDRNFKVRQMGKAILEQSSFESGETVTVKKN